MNMCCSSVYTQQFLLWKYAQLYVGYMSYGGALIAHGPYMCTIDFVGDVMHINE